jgi:hypothetical protein
MRHGRTRSASFRSPAHSRTPVFHISEMQNAAGALMDPSRDHEPTAHLAHQFPLSCPRIGMPRGLGHHTGNRKIHSVPLLGGGGVRTYVDFSTRMLRSEPARHAGAGRAAADLLAAPLHHAGSTPVVVSSGGRHSAAVRTPKCIDLSHRLRRPLIPARSSCLRPAGNIMSVIEVF